MRGIRPSVDAPALDYVQLSVDARAGRNPSLKKRAGAPVTMVSLAVCATDLRMPDRAMIPHAPALRPAASCHGARPQNGPLASPSAAAASRRSDPALAAAVGAAAKLSRGAHGPRLRASKRIWPGPGRRLDRDCRRRRQLGLGGRSTRGWYVGSGVGACAWWHAGPEQAPKKKGGRPVQPAPVMPGQATGTGGRAPRPPIRPGSLLGRSLGPIGPSEKNARGLTRTKVPE
jgi:hypothetical protein